MYLTLWTIRTTASRSVRRPFFSWFRAGAMADLSKERPYETQLLHNMRVSVCSVQGQRKYMEDEFVTAHDFCAVFDGHGGKSVAQYLRFNILASLQAELPLQQQHTTPAHSVTLENYVDALYRALDKVDQQVQSIVHWSFQGATCLAVWIHPDPDPVSLLIANVGDSRAVLSRNQVAYDVTREHRPDDPRETDRITAVGGQVICEPGGIPRVNGNLALSRSIGDRAERPAVSAEPEISILTRHATDEFLILATDGLWDVWESEDAVHLVHRLLESEEVDRDSIAQYLVEEALRRGSHDNITVIILWMNESEEPPLPEIESST